MPDNLTDTEEVRLLDLSLLNTDKLALVTTLSTDAAAGTESTGGTYARQTLTWAAASAGAKATSAALTYTGLAASELTGWEVWDTAGTGRKWYGLWSPQAGSATAAGDTINATAHGLSNGDKVVFQTGFVPAGLAAGTKYFVVGATTNTFQVAATSGGSAVDITADAASVVYGKVLIVAAGGGLNLAVGAITCSLS